MKMRSSLYNTRESERRDVQGTSSRPLHLEEEVIRENEAILNALGGAVHRMKASAASLREEAGDHNRLLDTLSTAFSGATGGVNATVLRIEGVMGRYGWRHALLIAAVLFFVIYGASRFLV